MHICICNSFFLCRIRMNAARLDRGFNVYAVDVQGQGVHFMHWAFDSNKSLWRAFGSLSTINLRPAEDSAAPNSIHAAKNACIQATANLNSPPLMPQWLHSFYFHFFLIDVLKHFEAILVRSGDYSDCRECRIARDLDYTCVYGHHLCCKV